jgi:hypothetical protein
MYVIMLILHSPFCCGKKSKEMPKVGIAYSSVTNLGQLALNPSGMASPTAAATPQGKGYDTRYILFLPPSNDGITSSYIAVRNP